MPKTIKRLPDLPIERAIRTISGRWKAVILYYLLDGPKRLSELSRKIPSISQKVLVQQLRELENHGLVTRTVIPQVPVRVDYAATALGLSLEPIMLALCEWGQRHAATLSESDHLADCIVRPVNT